MHSNKDSLQPKIHKLHFKKPQWDITSHLLEWLLFKNQEIKSRGKNMEKLEPFSLVMGMQDGQSLWKKYGYFLNKLNTELPYDPAILFLDIYPKELKNQGLEQILVYSLFKIAKRWKQTKCPYTDEWVNKMWYLHTREYHSDTCCNTEETLRHYAEWNKPMTKKNFIWFYLYGVLTGIKFRETEDRMENYYLIGKEFQFGKVKKFWRWIVVMLS